MKLYFKAGACSLSPHIALREAGIAVELVAVDLQTKQLTDGSDYLKINPKGAVPALEIEAGEILTEGAAIVQFIADYAKNTTLLPAAGTLARYRVQELLNYIATEIHKGFAPLFSSQTPADYKTIALESLSKKFDYMTSLLGNKDYLTGDQFTVADGYLFNTLFWTRWVNIDLAKWPVLHAFFNRVANRPYVRIALEAEGLTA